MNFFEIFLAHACIIFFFVNFAPDNSEKYEINVKRLKK
jgi:hypothetical protein